jgi:undecaprenyl diphosphate synthase
VSSVPDPDKLATFFDDPRALPLLDVLDPDRVPSHVAIIMDGNGRWAAQRRKPRLAGHRQGALAVREAIGTAIQLGIEYLTIYSFSSENWTRSEEEVSGLMTLFVEVLERELASLQKRGVRVLVAGDMSALPSKTREAFERCVAKTAGNPGLTLVVALNYGSRQELTAAARALAREVAAGTLAPDDIDEQAIEAHLYTAGIPDPDLLVRTSGEMRLSNFLLWQAAYTELWITEVLWPDFARTDLLEAVIAFQRRSRRFGGAE